MLAHGAAASTETAFRFPALFVRGTTVISDDSWQVSYVYRTRYAAAATAGFTDPAAPPAAFRLATQPVEPQAIQRDNRWLWSGDAYQSYLMNYYLFFDLDVTRRTMVALRGKNPIEEHLNTILDYSLYWFLGLRDYYDYTGDLAFIRQQYPNMLSLVAFCVERANAEGLLEGQPDDWVFVDWADMPKDGALAFEQLLFCLSLDTVVLFAELLGDEATANIYCPQAIRLREDIRARFWDAECGAFIHRLVAGQPDSRITKHPTMIALLYGFLTPEERVQVKASVLQNPAVPAITTPYMRFYELAAMGEAGEHAYVLEEIRNYWGGMLRLGATSFWEEYDPQIGLPEQYAMYGRPFGKSLCHAWGASPIYLFGKYFLGVTPAAPGYRETLIQPRLGDLAWMEGAVPTPHGDVQVFVDQQMMRVAIPHGSAILRFSSAAPPRATAGQLVALGGSRYELRFDAANQSVEVHYIPVTTDQ